MKLNKYLVIIFLILTTLFPYKTYAFTSSSYKNNKYIIFIDINNLTLSLLDNESKELIKSYPVAIGKKDTPSPIGQWTITSKAKKNGPFGGYWLGLNVPWDTFGIHGTSNPGSIGSLASGGCIRMFNSNIQELFQLVDYDTIVIIYPGPNWRFSCYDRSIKPNDKGTDVYLVQKALKNIGYYDAMPDGIYSYKLELAIEQYRIDSDIPGDSTIDSKLLDSLGLYKFE